MFHAGFLLVRGRVGRAVTSALLTVLASAAAYVAGVDLFSMFELSCKLSVDNEVTATVLCAVVQVVAWLAVVLAAALDPSAGRRSRWLAAAFAPPGAVLRWMLARLNKEDMPRGTFLANMLASLIDCILASLLYRRVGGTRASVWFSAMFTGFAGSLSTISTFVGELRALPSGKRLAYAIFSVCVAQFLFLVIYGVVVWTS